MVTSSSTTAFQTMEECHLRLKRFTHQANGGKPHIFDYDSTTVCKPLWDQEYKFYSTIPKTLAQFIPAFKGVVEIEAEKVEIAQIKLSQWLRKQSKSFSNVDYSPYDGDNRNNHLENQSREIKSLCVDSSVLARIRHHRDGMPLSYNQRQFILLENVVSNFHRPCVIDLKMGTRHHSDEEDIAKQQLREKLCMASTSAKLGVRLGGMQVYQVGSGDYLRRDKYYGRLLTEDGLRDALCEFLNNGERVRVELIDLIIERLQVCYSAVNDLNSYRFFGSSLLIIYEGAIGRNDGRNGLFVDDHGDQNIANSLVMNTHLPTVDLDRVRNGAIVEPTQTATVNDTSPILSLGRDESRTISHVDVRLVDFANATSDFHQSDHANCNQESDTGFLFGLQSLMRMFEEIKRKEFHTKNADIQKLSIDH